MDLEFNCCSCHGFQSIFQIFPVVSCFFVQHIFNSSELIWPQPSHLDVLGAGMTGIGRVQIGMRLVTVTAANKNSAGRCQMCQRWLFTISWKYGQVYKMHWLAGFLFALGVAWEPKMAPGKADGKRWKKKTKYWETAPFPATCSSAAIPNLLNPRWCLWTSRVSNIHFAPLLNW